MNCRCVQFLFYLGTDYVDNKKSGNTYTIYINIIN